MALRDGRRRPKTLKYERGTPVKDRVEPQLQALGYDTSTLEIKTPYRGQIHWIVLNERVIGTYNHRFEEMQLSELPED